MLLNLLPHPLPSRSHKPNRRFACVALYASVCDKCACVLSVWLHWQASKPSGEWRVEGLWVWQGGQEWGRATRVVETQCRMAAAWMHAQLIALIAYGAGSEKTVCVCVWDEYLFYVVWVRVLVCGCVRGCFVCALVVAIIEFYGRLFLLPPLSVANLWHKSNCAMCRKKSCATHLCVCVCTLWRRWGHTHK